MACLKKEYQIIEKRGLPCSLAETTFGAVETENVKLIRLPISTRCATKPIQAVDFQQSFYNLQSHPLSHYLTIPPYGKGNEDRGTEGVTVFQHGICQCSPTLLILSGFMSNRLFLQFYFRYIDRFPKNSIFMGLSNW